MATLTQLVIPRLAIRPHHHLLEIGCGNGTTAAAVAQRLATGSILAIDRSGATITRARQRSADHIARGVARILQVDLADLTVPANHFHTVFALNVTLFQADELWTVELVRRALRRHGRLVLGFSRPDADHLAARADRVCAGLRAGGLAEPVVEWTGPHNVWVSAARA